jgi:hypothetical protein
MHFSARLCENLCVLCVKILFEIDILSFDTTSVATGSSRWSRKAPCSAPLPDILLT